MSGPVAATIRDCKALYSAFRLDHWRRYRRFLLVTLTGDACRHLPRQQNQSEEEAYLAEQRGLKLEPATAPVSVVVIDSVERPAAN